LESPDGTFVPGPRHSLCRRQPGGRSGRRPRNTCNPPGLGGRDFDSQRGWQTASAVLTARHPVVRTGWRNPKRAWCK